MSQLATQLKPVTRGDAAKELLRRRQARAGVLAFSVEVFRGYQSAPHLVLLADHLERLARREITRLLVVMPPRHGKSQLASINFPAWYLGQNPEHQIIGCSYGDSLAYANSFATLQLMRSDEYQTLWPTLFVAEGATRWQIKGKANNRASYVAAGVGAGITGEGADCLIIDDPLRNQEVANSALIREKQWEWYGNVARTRLQPGGVVCLIMTRWHSDDLAGRILEQQKNDLNTDRWTVLHLPAIMGETQALWPEQYPLDVLLTTKATMGSRAFESLYQGNPSAATGNVFLRFWWRYYRERPPFTGIIQSWDTAFKRGDENDYSVCTTWGIARDGYYLLDVWRQRVEFPELKRAVIALAARDRPRSIIVEDKASGQSLIQELKKDTALPVLPIKVDADKVTRANAITPSIEAGRVFLPESAPWLADFVEELAEFPNGSFDDQVDSVSQALNYLRQRNQSAIIMGEQQTTIFQGRR